MAFWNRPRDFVELLPQAAAPGALAAMRDQLLASPYLRQNVLNSRFETTQGFSVIYRDSARLHDKFPSLAAFTALLGARPDVSLCYLNVLVIGAAGKVDRHVDHSIRGYDPQLPLPWRVSVLYLEVPAMDGGELLIYDGAGAESRRIRPETGLLVHFSGASKHAVAEISRSESPRISLVCEQYRLKPRQLAAVPAFTIKSMAPFAAFLAGEANAGDA